MFDEGDTPPQEATMAPESDEVPLNRKPKGKTERQKVKAAGSKVKTARKSKPVTPAILDDISDDDPEVKLYQMIAIRRNIAELKARNDPTGKSALTIQALQRKITSLMNELAPKVISYSDPFEVALPVTTPVLGGHLRKRTFYDANSS